MVIEEGSIPGGLARILPAVMAATAAALGPTPTGTTAFDEQAREIESLVRGPYHGAVNHTQTFLVMSHDGADGEDGSSPTTGSRSSGPGSARCPASARSPPI